MVLVFLFSGLRCFFLWSPSSPWLLWLLLSLLLLSSWLLLLLLCAVFSFTVLLILPGGLVELVFWLCRCFGCAGDFVLVIFVWFCVLVICWAAVFACC